MSDNCWWGGGRGDLLSGGGRVNEYSSRHMDRGQREAHGRLILIFNETLFFFRNGMTHSSTYLFPDFYLGAKIFFSLFPFLHYQLTDSGLNVWTDAIHHDSCLQEHWTGGPKLGNLPCAA